MTAVAVTPEQCDGMAVGQRNATEAEKSHNGQGITHVLSVMMAGNAVDQVIESKDKRRFQRYPVNLACSIEPRTVRDRAGPATVQTQTKDMSAGGLFFIATADFKVGTKIVCTIQLPIKSARDNVLMIHCRGEIVRVVPLSQGGIGFGATIDSFKFVDSTQSQAERTPMRRKKSPVAERPYS